MWKRTKHYYEVVKKRCHWVGRGERILLDVDGTLEKLGEFGRYQMKFCALVVLPILCSAIYNSSYVFTVFRPQIRCRIPECEKAGGPFKPGPWAQWALVKDKPCFRREPIGKACVAASFGKKEVPCKDFLYATQDSVVAKFDLACQEWKQSFVGTAHSIGVLTALVYVGVMSDTIGRRTTMVITIVLAGGVGAMRVLSRSYVDFVVLEYLDAALGAGAYTSGYILAVEMMESKHRVLSGSIMSMMYAAGQATLALVAWAVPRWDHLILILYLPSLLFIFYPCLVDESIRWLLVNGKREAAYYVLQRIADQNRKQLELRIVRQLHDVEDEETHVKKKWVIREVFSSRILALRMLVCAFCWVSVTLTYYGLNINSVSLGGNKYVNFVLTCLVEIPGYLISYVTLDRYGRKLSIMVSLIFCGISLFVMPFTQKWRTVMLTLLAKCSVSVAYGGMYIYTLELAPTSVRHCFMTACSTVGHAGAVAAPLTPPLVKIARWLPYVIFGFMTLGGSALLLLIPETLNKPLPDTVEEAEELSPSVARRRAIERANAPPKEPSKMDARRESSHQDAHRDSAYGYQDHEPPDTSHHPAPLPHEVEVKKKPKEKKK